MAGAVTIDHAAARSALAAVTPRTAELLSSLADPHVAVKNSEWKAGDVGAHLIVALRAFAAAARGDVEGLKPFIPETEVFFERLAAVTAATLLIEPERDAAALGRLLAEAAKGFLSATVDLPADHVVPTPWYGPQASLPLDAATCLLVAEQLVHGYDVATTVNTPWPISPAEACLVAGAVATMLPLAADPGAIKGKRATFDVRVRGGPQFMVRVAEGKVAVEAGSPAGPVDCHLSADPVAFVMVAYGRLNQWGPIARGGLVAWGRKPWLGPQFRGFFVNP